MKLLLFSDLHLDSPFAWLGGNLEAARRRRRALRETLENVAGLARSLEVDALLCGGDLYEHARVSPDTMAFVRATFAALAPIPVYVAPGNHDWYGPQSAYAQTDWSPNVHLYRADRLEPMILADGVTLWGGANCSPANTRNFLDGFVADRTGINLALFHGAEQGWFSDPEEDKTPHAPFWPEQIKQAGLLHAFLGHYHAPRDATNHTYPGNPDPLTFGEDGSRGAVLFALGADGALTRERHVVAVTTIQEFSLDVTGCAGEQDIRRKLVEVLAGQRGVVRVTLSGELDPAIDFRPRDLERDADHLDGFILRRGEVHISYDLESIAIEPTVRGQFVRDVQAAELAEEDRRRVLITGLRAFGGRDDLEVD